MQDFVHQPYLTLSRRAKAALEEAIADITGGVLHIRRPACLSAFFFSKNETACRLDKGLGFGFWVRGQLPYVSMTRALIAVANFCRKETTN